MLNYKTFTTNRNLTISHTDSTNAYAHNLIDTNSSHHGQMVLALKQSKGKGQRGNKWYSGVENEQIACSLILHHEASDLNNMYLLNMAVSLAILETLSKYAPSGALAIKWSNDIILNNKKIAGVLIENIIRGSSWTHSIIGIGLNVNNIDFPADLPKAISLYQCTHQIMDKEIIETDLYKQLENWLQKAIQFPAIIMQEYNKQLWKINLASSFIIDEKEISCLIKKVDANGHIHLQIDDEILSYPYGMAKQTL